MRLMAARRVGSSEVLDGPEGIGSFPFDFPLSAPEEIVEFSIGCLCASSSLAHKDNKLAVEDGVDDSVFSDSDPVQVVFEM